MINPGVEFVPLLGKHSRKSWILQLPGSHHPGLLPAGEGALQLPSLTLGRVNWTPAPNRNLRSRAQQGQTEPSGLQQMKWGGMGWKWCLGPPSCHMPVPLHEIQQGAGINPQQNSHQGRFQPKTSAALGKSAAQSKTG